jgi:hypothetical protein
MLLVGPRSLPDAMASRFEFLPLKLLPGRTTTSMLGGILLAAGSVPFSEQYAQLTDFNRRRLAQPCGSPPADRKGFTIKLALTDGSMTRAYNAIVVQKTNWQRIDPLAHFHSLVPLQIVKSTQCSGCLMPTMHY